MNGEIGCLWKHIHSIEKAFSCENYKPYINDEISHNAMYITICIYKYKTVSLCSFCDWYERVVRGNGNRASRPKGE